MNRVALMGNLTADPEIRYTPAGKGVCEFTVAVNERWKTESGEQKERKAFIACSLWGPRGEAFAKWHRKGVPALVEGKLRQDEWEDKATGKKQRKTYVEVTDWHFCGGKRDPQDAPAMRPLRSEPTKAPKPAPAQPEAEDDVPF